MVGVARIELATPAMSMQEAVPVFRFFNGNLEALFASRAQLVPNGMINSLLVGQV